MVGATVAQQHTKTNNDTFLTAFNANSSQLDDNDPTASMDNLIPSANGWPIEDLTGEVHDLMLRESMTWLPWMDENDTNSSVKDVFPMEGFDSQLLAQTLQLDGLFGQDLNLDHLDEASSSLLYDELTFDPSPTTTPMSSPTSHHPMVQEPSPVDSDVTESISSVVSPIHQNHATEQYHETFEEIEQDDENEPLPAIGDVKEDDSSTDDDDDEDDGDSDEEDGPVSVMTTTYMYLPKRQVEEALLNKITQHLQSDKLPGILSIVSSATDDQKDGEVEIDLSCLSREQLVRVMLYVDACITEQQGGPKVKLSDYIVKDESPKVMATTAATMAAVSDDDDDEAEEKMDATAGQKRRRRRKPTTIPDDGPMSMAALTKKSRPRKQQPDTSITDITTSTPSLSTAAGPKRRRTRKKQHDASVSIPVNSKYQDPNCLASTRPKRRSAALHKRRMLEEMLLVPSDDDDNMGATIEEDGLDHQVMVTYGEEQMDFRVVDNQTIVHQPHISSSLPLAPVSMTQISSHGDGTGLSIAINDDDDDEEIDIM